MIWNKIGSRKAISSSIFLLSAAVSVFGFWSIATRFHMQFWMLTVGLLVVSISYHVLGVYHYFESRIKQASWIVLFGSILSLLIILSMFIPEILDLRRWEVSAAIPDYFFYSLILVITGLVSSYFSFRPFYDYTKEGVQVGAYYVLHVAMLLTVLALFLIVITIAVRGAGGITWEFLTQDIISMGEEGGVYPAILGTLALIALTAVIVLPLGVGTAVYLVEYANEGLLLRVVRTAVNILQGTPSIVHGLFGYTFFVIILFDGQKSVLAGALTLAVLTLPIVTRSTEEALKSVPDEMRNASLALGATKWQTIKEVVVPSSLPGILTGTVLGLGRAAGETAPIMMTAVYFSGAGTPSGLLEPIQALPYHLLTLYRFFGYREVESQAWATALLLLIIVLGINLSAIIVREKFRRRN
ncbi:MAG: phosphate ABC transporter permease PstA [Candidatus Aenigmatarchaeota archaeon]